MIEDLARAFVVGIAFGGVLQTLGWMPRLTRADVRLPVTSYLLLVLTTWAGGIWLRPATLVWFVDPWWPFALSGVFAAIAIALMSVPRRVRMRSRTTGRVVAQERPPSVLPVNFIGLVMFSLAMAISARYVVG